VLEDAKAASECAERSEKDAGEEKNEEESSGE
jgi:hypothetical protein